eukprot:12981420-Alexandrium_andersonii.AAC.1
MGAQSVIGAQQRMNMDSARTQQACIRGIEMDCVVQGAIGDAVDMHKELRKDSVGHKNERTRSRQGFSR